MAKKGRKYKGWKIFFLTVLVMVVAVATAGCVLWQRLSEGQKQEVEAQILLIWNNIGKLREPYDSKKFDGIDVSHWNGIINWEKIGKYENLKFVYIKATEGAKVSDCRYRRNLEGAKKQHLRVGSYHLLSTQSSVRAQFENFKRHVDRSEQDLIPMLDIEADIGWRGQQLRDSVALFSSLVKKHYGKKPLIYASHDFYNVHLSPHFDDHHLFIARYGQKPRLKSGAAHQLWQSSNYGRLQGMPFYAFTDFIRLQNGTSVEKLRLR